MPQVVAGGIVSAFGITSVVGVALVNIGVGVGFSLLANQFNKPANRNRAPGIQTETTTVGESIGQKFTLGTYGTNGHQMAIRYSHRKDGQPGPGSVRTTVLDLSDVPMPGTRLHIVFVNGVRLTIDPTSEDPDYGFTVSNPKYAGKIFFKYYDGTQTAADPMMLDKYGSHDEHPWTVNHIGRETCYVIVTQFRDTEIFRGDSQFRFENIGIPLYDPSLDDTVGGSGDHRWADKATWEPSGNAMVQAYNVARGIDVKLGKTFGGGYADDELPLDWWIPAIIACRNARAVLNDTFNNPASSYQDTLDNDIPTGAVTTATAAITDPARRRPMEIFQQVINGEADPTVATDYALSLYQRLETKISTISRFAAGIEVNLAAVENGGTTPIEIMDELAKAALAQYADVGGTLYVRVGVPQAPDRFITDRDVLIDDVQDLTPFSGHESKYTAVTATFPSQDLGYEVREAKEKRDTDLEARFGYRPAGLNLKAVTTEAMAQDVMASYLADAQRDVRLGLTLPPEFHDMIPLNALDYVSEQYGFQGKDFEVAEVAIDPATLSTTLSVREIDPTDTALAVDQEVINPEPSIVPLFFLPETVPGAGAEGAVIVDGNGVSRRPGWRGFWSALEDDVTGIDWEVRPDGQTTVIATGSVPKSRLADLEFYSSEGIAALADYQARFKLVADRDTLWTDWYPFTAPQVGFTQADFDATVNVALDAGRNALADGFELANDYLDLLLRVTEEQATGADNFDGARAVIFEEQTIREEADLAQATLITGLGASLGDAEARIVTVETTKVTATEAIAAVGQELTAQNGDFEALGRFDAIARAAENSSQTLFLFTAQAGQADAALEIAALSDGALGSASRVKITSDTFIVDSNLSVFGGAIQSVDYVEGVSGWYVGDDKAQFTNIQDLAVFSDFDYTLAGADSTFTETTLFTISGINFLSPTKVVTCAAGFDLLLTQKSALDAPQYFTLRIQYSTNSGSTYTTARTKEIIDESPGGSFGQIRVKNIAFSLGILPSDVNPSTITNLRVRIQSGFVSVMEDTEYKISNWLFEFQQR